MKEKKAKPDLEAAKKRIKEAKEKQLDKLDLSSLHLQEIPDGFKVDPFVKTKKHKS